MRYILGSKFKDFRSNMKVNFITAVANIDTSGISMLEEFKKTVDRKGLQVIIHRISSLHNKFKYQIICHFRISEEY